MDGETQFILNWLSALGQAITGEPVDENGLRLILTFGASGILGIGVCAVIGTVLAARARVAHGLRPKGQMPPHLSQSTWRRAAAIALFLSLLWHVMIGVRYGRLDLALAGLIGFMAGIVFRIVNQNHDPGEQKAQNHDDF